jgi:Spy/CpxP family protein refolding chaperone
MNTAARTPQRPTGLLLASATALLALTAAVWPLHSQAQGTTTAAQPATSSNTTADTTPGGASPRGPQHARHPGDGPARPMHAKHHGPGPGGPGDLPGGRSLQVLLDHAKATPEQRTQIEALMSQARQDLRNQQDSSRSTHLQLMQALAQPTVDTRAIESLRQQSLAQHDKASQRLTQALVDAAKLLTPEQRANLSQHLASLERPARGDRAERTRAERPPRGTAPPQNAAPGTAPASR